MSKFEEAMAASEGAGGAGAVDSLWDSVFGAPLPAEEADRGGEFDLLPRFNDYRYRVEHVEGRLIGKDAYPALHVGIRIVAGPAGTVNRVVWDDLFLVPFPRRDETPAAAADRLRLLMSRFRNHLRLASDHPMGADVDALTAYGRQFVGKEVIGGIRVEGERKDDATGRTYDARNRIIFESWANPDVEWVDRTKTPPKPSGMTYDQRSKAAIGKYEAKAAGATGGGKTAGGSFGSPQPTDFFGGGGGKQ